MVAASSGFPPQQPGSNVGGGSAPGFPSGHHPGSAPGHFPPGPGSGYGPPGYNQPPGGFPPGQPWPQPPSNGGGNAALYVVLGGIFTALVLFAGAAFVLTRNDDQGIAADSTTTSPEAVTTTVAQTTTTRFQEVPSTEFALQPVDVGLGGETEVADETMVEADESLCSQPTSQTGFQTGRTRAFTRGVDSFMQGLVQFDTPENAAASYESYVRGGVCVDQEFTDSGGNTLRITAEHVPLAQYGDRTQGFVSEIIDPGNGVTFHTRSFLFLDGTFVYWGTSFGVLEITPEETNQALVLTAQRYGLT